MTSIEAQKIQDRIFQKMTADEKIKMVSHFFNLGKKLNKLNDRKINGGDAVSSTDSRNIK